MYSFSLAVRGKSQPRPRAYTICFKQNHCYNKYRNFRDLRILRDFLLTALRRPDFIERVEIVTPLTTHVPGDLTLDSDPL
jgi:hypothetical protein